MADPALLDDEPELPLDDPDAPIERMPLVRVLRRREVREVTVPASHMPFVADPPPREGDEVLKPWALRQFEALQQTLTEQADRIAALERSAPGDEADTWDGGTAP